MGGLRISGEASTFPEEPRGSPQTEQPDIAHRWHGNGDVLLWRGRSGGGGTRGADTFSYLYDLAGNLTRCTYPDGTVVDYSFDEDERVAAAVSGGWRRATPTTSPAT